MSGDFDVVEFAQRFRAFMDAVSRLAPPEDVSRLREVLEEHFGRDPRGLPVVTDSYPVFEHADVQAGLDAYLAEDGRTSQLIGISGPSREHLGLSDIVEAAGRHRQFDIGAIDYAAVATGPRTETTCVSFGMYLISAGGQRLAALLRVGARRTGAPQVVLEVLTQDAAVARCFLEEVRKLRTRHSVFRGQVLSFEPDEFGDGASPLRFHQRPEVAASGVILPAGALDALTRQVIGVAMHRNRLLASGHHLKRGVVMYGPPGTGKTHTVRHLLGRLPQSTVILLTGPGTTFIREACELARRLAPAIVVLEDVDLVAEERGRSGARPLLFQLLNEMDGVDGDADIAFLLTTNRLGVLEPALTQRPGRVDLVVEVPLPDESGRGRLLALYGRSLRLSDGDVRLVVEATEGATASFFAELSRRAELLAATAGDECADLTHTMKALGELRATQETFNNVS